MAFVDLGLAQMVIDYYAMDPQYKLIPGMTKVENGKKYVFNENHRWARPGDEEKLDPQRPLREMVLGDHYYDADGRRTMERAEEAGGTYILDEMRNLFKIGAAESRKKGYDPVSELHSDNPRTDGGWWMQYAVGMINQLANGGEHEYLGTETPEETWEAIQEIWPGDDVTYASDGENVEKPGRPDDWEPFPPGQTTVKLDAMADRMPKISQDEANDRINQWKQYAQKQGETGQNKNKVVISLFDSTGVWSKPWKEAGYTVARYDASAGADLNLHDWIYQQIEEFGDSVYCVLSACPCITYTATAALHKDRHFSEEPEDIAKVWGQRALYTDAKSARDYNDMMLEATKKIIKDVKPAIYALENPRKSRLRTEKGLGEPLLSFHPHNFGFPFNKQTGLWGEFKTDLPLAPVENTGGDWAHQHSGNSYAGRKLRSLTPEGFAYSFFMANHEPSEKQESPAPPPRAPEVKVEDLPQQIGRQQEIPSRNSDWYRGSGIRYLTGSSGPEARELAGRESNLGLMITPDTISHLKHIDSFSTFAVDNGVFGGNYSDEKFTNLLEAIAKVPGASYSALFVTAPDVFDRATMTGDAKATIEKSRPWLKKIRDLGLPAAMVAQDGLQDIPEEIPWDEFDVLFIGGSDEFKLGRYTDEDYRKWNAMIDEAHRRGKPVHIGRVNSAKRMEFADRLKADSVDGNYLAFGPRKNAPAVEKWLADSRRRDVQATITKTDQKNLFDSQPPKPEPRPEHKYTGKLSKLKNLFG